LIDLEESRCRRSDHLLLAPHLVPVPPFLSLDNPVGFRRQEVNPSLIQNKRRVTAMDMHVRIRKIARDGTG
jgi:hypothetical protein